MDLGSVFGFLGCWVLIIWAMAAGGQSEAQQKMMQYMPIIFGFLFYSMPSGLTVYFLISTVLGLVQQYFVQKAA